MSADDESSIVILDETPSMLEYETPSMLQYSILDASSLNHESIISENNSDSANNLMLSNGLQNGGQSSSTSLDTSGKTCADSIINTANGPARIYSNENQPKSVQSSLTSSQQPVLSETNGRPHPTATLAQSFLLGAIDCDTMKVRK